MNLQVISVESEYDYLQWSVKANNYGALKHENERDKIWIIRLRCAFWNWSLQKFAFHSFPLSCQNKYIFIYFFYMCKGPCEAEH